VRLRQTYITDASRLPTQLHSAVDYVVCFHGCVAVGGCDGLTDVMWQNRQRISIDGLRVRVHYTRRYSYAEEVHEQVRALKREEANAMSGRDLDDPRGDWWDQPGDVSGTLQVATGSILWDDGTVWERHDGSMHDKPVAVAAGATTESLEGGQQPQQQSREQLSRDRRQRKVQEMREKAAKQAGAGKKSRQKQQKQPKTVQSPPKKKPLPTVLSFADNSEQTLRESETLGKPDTSDVMRAGGVEL